MDPEASAAVAGGTAGGVRVSPAVSLGKRTPSSRTWSSHKQARLARVASVALWTLVGLAAVGGIAGVLSATRGDDAGRAASLTQAASTSPSAEGFAELYVMTWLSAGEGEEDQLLSFSTDPVSFQGRKPDTFRVRWAGTVGARLIEPNYWSITVAADVEQASGRGYESVGVRYYQVPVLAGDDGLVVTSLPSQVPAPARSERPPLDLTADSPLLAGEVADTIERFFAAYLTEQGDVERYLRPGAQVRAVEPAPFVETKIAAGNLREMGNSASAAVQVTGKDAAGQTTTTAYALQLQRRDGRWEVAEILAAPPLARVTPLQEKGRSK